ncbi:cell division protein FtsZ [Microbaculum marinisediminis]|uniref:Cell division protein FtsZ n=1 Tax=Microbaculum marinisediminis TaxID=2931392 RepID=A0AAW5R1P7_9HYPH|nr:cell division protein FtsZ [Microbaculum sp. A6E488]MCT8972583.1 cell division protein FtsZ [Microbaculum sp. A6E488]
MTINLKMPDLTELKPKITVFGVGGAGGNAVNNMIESGLKGVEFVVANTDSQALTMSSAERIVQMGVAITEGLGAGSQPEVGRAAAEETIDEINDHLGGSHMVFITAGMGGGTGTGAAPVIAQAARDMGILTVGVVTKPFDFEGKRRMAVANAGIESLQQHVDTLIVIPNQNLFRIANERTTFSEAFGMADEVLYSGVACITDLMVKEGLINLDFADVRAVMRAMGKAMMGTGEASGDQRAIQAAEAAIANPLLDESSMRGARGLLISITGGNDLTLFEVDEAATRIREEVDPDANIILGATFDESLEGIIRVSVVATGIDQVGTVMERTAEDTITELTERLRARKAKTSEAAPAQMPAQAQIPVQAPAPTYEQVAAATEVAEAAVQAALAPEVPEAAPQPVPAPAPAPAPAPMAARDHGVQISRMEPPAAPAMPPAEAPMAEDTHAGYGDPFVPPVASHPERRQARMPRIEDFPLIAQKEMRAKSGSGDHGAHESRRPGLLQRLASVGLGRREESDDSAPVQPPMVVSHATEEPVSEYARRPQRPAHPEQPKHAPQVANAPRRPSSIDDDQYEIPAFLRRQAN